MHVSHTLFEEIVRAETARVLDSLPSELREKAGEVTVLIADRPTHIQADQVGDDDLLGLYEGVSLVDRHVTDSETVADQITLFRVPLMEMCRTLNELKEEIRITFIHELGHYFGFEEGDLESRGL
jgi:predicted Zn-dependent protease with MMP-like domain